MASTATWILSLKVLFISTGVLSLAFGLKVSVPLVLDFSVSQAPVIWSSVASWLRPPFLYVIINGIIITIVASSRFHRRDGDNEKADHQQVPVPKITVDPNPAFEYAVKNSRSDFGVAEPSVVVFEQKQREVVEAGDVVEDKNVVVEDLNGDRGDELATSKSEWNPLRMMDSSEIPMEILLPAEKPLVSARFGHRKLVNKSSPEGFRSLRVAKPKRHETLENTWKMITEKKAMPLSRHLKKSETFKDTWPNQVNVDPLTEPSPVVKKSETFKDRTNFQLSPTQVSSSPASVLKLRKEPSLSKDELNRRVEAFIKKFNEEMRLQRQESLNQYEEMINRGSH